jgi:hypothetical protein
MICDPTSRKNLTGMTFGQKALANETIIVLAQFSMMSINKSLNILKITIDYARQLS